MSKIDELFEEGLAIAEHVGMTEVNPRRRYESTKDKEDFTRTLLDYIFWLNEETQPAEKVVNPKINDDVIDYYTQASDFGE